MEGKRISDWKYILLDTSFIIDFLSDPQKFEHNPTKKENIELAKQIMNKLSDDKRDEKPQFLITAITVGELKYLASISATKVLMRLFSCGDVTILPYGKTEAEILNNLSYQIKKSKQPNVTDKQLLENSKIHKCFNLRAWINDDMKIVACAKYQYDKRKLDVILTSDKNTFLPVAKFAELPCLTLDSKCFPKDLFGELE